MRNIIISDTSCFIVLDKIQQLSLLQKVYNTVITTDEVIAEFGNILPSWIVVKKVIDKNFQASLESILGKGESSAISLAIENKGSTLLIDEKKGRKIASELGIQITGTLGVIVKAKESGFIPLISPLLNQLKSVGFYISAEVEHQILFDAGEI